MTARRLDRTAAIFGIALALTLGGRAQAQLSAGQWRLIPQPNTGRIAVEVKQEPTVVFANPGLGSTVFSRQPIAVSRGPAILMSDGTVFANFGGGFQPVAGSCSGAVVVVGQPRVIASNGVVLYEPPPPTYMQAAPAQMTSSQQMLPSMQRGQSRNLARVDCFNRGARGRAVGHRN